MGLTYDTAAQSLGVARSTYALYVAPHGQPPRAVALACAALAAGLPPWPGNIIAAQAAIPPRRRSPP
jgi:hypothetical protein